MEKTGSTFTFSISTMRRCILHFNIAFPGCGKSMLAHAIAGQLAVPFIKVAAPELVGANSGDSERSIRDLFSQAVDEALTGGRGCIVFLDGKFLAKPNPTLLSPRFLFL